MPEIQALDAISTFPLCCWVIREGLLTLGG